MTGGIHCTWMRGGTSKGAFFLAEDLPAGVIERDRLLLRIMGSPDTRQIDGIGGGHPLTSKVAIVGTSDDPRADVDYLFLQVGVDSATVSSSQNCGNLLAGVGQFALERGLVVAGERQTTVRIKMLNSDSYAASTFPTPSGNVEYSGTGRIDGVPGTAAEVSIAFSDTAGSSCGKLLPTGNVIDVVDGIEVTCIDNGMPTVVLAATDVGVSGHESPSDLENNAELGERVATIRAQAAKLMGLGDVTESTIPKITLVSEPRADGSIATRTFIPVRCHTAIGVLGALTVGTAARLGGSVAERVTRTRDGGVVRIEHPTGFFDVDIEVESAASGEVDVRRAAVIRTARKLFAGEVFPGPERAGTYDSFNG